MSKKSYIFDTSVFLSDAQSVKHYKDGNIVIPFKVLEEIDNHKKRQDGVGSNARNIIRILDELRAEGALREGVQLNEGPFLYVKNAVQAHESYADLLPKDLDLSNPDNEIIAVALMEKYRNEDTVVVSRDINMRVKCDALGLKSEDYVAGQIVETKDSVYEGTNNCIVEDGVVDSFYANEGVVLNGEYNLCPNQYITLESADNPKKTALARYFSDKAPLGKIIDYKGVWGVRPRNKEQRFMIDLLMDEKVPIVSLIGKAGSGKTLCALASGLEQVVETSTNCRYNRLIVSRPIQPMGKDIGYLPGTMEEKMTPWLAPIQDNLKYLMGNDKHAFDMYLDRGVIEIEALTYIRGRSISDAYIIIDECQNMTMHEIKTILTRVGENTKIVLLGDIEQIDNIYIDETTNGLTYVIEKFKEHELAGHVTLKKGERSAVATLAAKVL